MVTQRASHTEHLLLGLWQDLFQRSDLTIQDNFFELGGYSLLSAYMVGRIELIFRLQLPPNQVFKTPTVALLAEYIDQALADMEQGPLSLPSLAPLRAGGSLPPLFCMHSYGGSVFAYRALSLRLPADRPIYGIEASGLNGQEQVLTTMAAMAEHCVKAIVTAQPHGPYYLAGHSFAGLLALEVASHLRAAGEEVALLALFDPWLIYDPRQPRFATSVKARLRTGRRKANSLLRRALRGQKSAPQLKTASAQQAEQEDAELGTPVAQLPPRFAEIHTACINAARKYNPARYQGGADYFCPAYEMPGQLFSQRAAWSYLIPNIKFHQVEAGHVSLLNEPKVALTGSILAERLAQTTPVEVAGAR